MYFFYRVLADSGVSLTSTLPDSGGISIGEALMKPTVIYVKEVKKSISVLNEFGSKKLLNSWTCTIHQFKFPVVFCKVLELVNRGEVKGLAHITGGGFTDNIPRIFPEGFGASIKANSWGIPPIFKWIQEVSRFKCYYIYHTSFVCFGETNCPQNIKVPL